MDLISTARNLAKDRYVKGKHQMFCALETESGQIFLGAHVEANNGRITLCAESVAVGAAATAGDTAVRTIVAVTESGDVVPPCGMCRELVYDYAPNANFILSDGDDYKLVPVAELLPQKYQSENYPNRRES